MKRKLLFSIPMLFALVLFFSVDGKAQGFENFDNLDLTGTSYQDGTFEGQDGSTWTFWQCRGDVEIDGKAIMIGRNRTPQSNFYSGTIEGGVGIINFDYMQAFGTNVNLNVLVNDVVVGNVTSSGEQNVVKNSGDIVVNTPGDIVLKFINVNNSDGQVVVDNIAWTAFDGPIPPIISNVTHSPEYVTSETTVSVSADVEEGDEPIMVVSLSYGTESGVYTGFITMNLERAGTYVTESDIPAYPDGTTVYYTITAFDFNGESSETPEHSYTVIDPAMTELPYEEAFEEDLGICYVVNIAGSRQWQHNTFGGNGFAHVSGFQSGELQDSWLVLPGIDMDEYSNVVLNFDSEYRYHTDVTEDNFFELLYSTDYPGIGDPSGYNWMPLDFEWPTVDAWGWIPSGDVALPDADGVLYLAFRYHYLTNHPTWRVDNINIDYIPDYITLLKYSDITGNKPDWFAESGGYSTRGLAAYDGKMYFASATDWAAGSAAPIVHVFDMETEEKTGELNVEGIVGDGGNGFRNLNDLEFSEDGVLFGANIGAPFNQWNFFKLWQFSLDPDVPPTKVIHCDSEEIHGRRLGDVINIVGRVDDGSLKLYAADTQIGADGNVFVWEMDGVDEDGIVSFADPYQISSEELKRAAFTAIAPIPEGDFYFHGNGADGQLAKFDENGENRVVISSGYTWRGGGIKYLGKNGNDEYIAFNSHVETKVIVYKLIDGDASNAVKVFETEHQGLFAGNSQGGGAGKLVFMPADNTKDGNNVIIAFSDFKHGFAVFETQNLDLEFPVYPAPVEDDDAITVFPWVEGFEAGELPEGWETELIQGPQGWEFFAGGVDPLVYVFSEQGFGHVEATLTTPRLNLTGHDVVTFAIRHMAFSETAPDGLPLEDAIGQIEVSLDGGNTWLLVEDVQTNISMPGDSELIQYDLSEIAANEADVKIRLVADIPDYDFFYVVVWEVFEVSVSTDPIATFDVTFNIVDEDGLPLADAIVTLDGVTNAAGEYVFTDLPQGSYDYLVQLEGYHDATGTVEVLDEDVTVDVEMDLIVFTVTFDVQNTNFVDVDDAVVTFNGVTNDPGDYVFVTVPGTFDYTVVADGYLDYTGDVEVTDNIIVHVFLEFEEMPPVALPFAEDFTGYEFGELPLGWARTTPYWQINDSDEAGGETPEMTYNFLNAVDQPHDSPQRLHTPWIDAGMYDEVTLSFSNYLFDNLGFITPDTEVQVQMTTDGENWIVLWQQAIANYGPETTVIELDGLAGEQFMIAFVIEKAAGFEPIALYWYIDDILIEGVEDVFVVDEFPWFESFEDEFPPEGWTNTTWEQSAWGAPNTGSEWAYSNLAGSELTTPEILVPAEDVYALSFWYRAEGANHPQDMDVLLSIDGENFDVVVAEIVGATNTDYEEVVYVLDDFAGESVWVKFIGQTGEGGFSWGILLDDVGVAEYEIPTFYTVTFEVEDEDGEPITDAVITLNGMANEAGDYVFEDIEAGEYDYLVTADGYEDAMGMLEVIDEDVIELVVMIEEVIAIEPLPWSEDFTGLAVGEIPDGWEATHVNWGATLTNFAGGESPEMRFNWTPNQFATHRLITPLLDNTDNEDYILTFKHYNAHFGGPYTLKVQSTTDGGVNWNDEWVIVDPTGNIGPETIEVDLAHLAGETFHLAWVLDGQAWNTDGWYIDDIVIEGLPPLPLDLIFNQEYFDGGTAATSAYDEDEEINLVVADNFSGLEDEIEEFAFYGLALKLIGEEWVEQTPADVEPFFVRFYEYEVGETTGLLAPVSGEYQVALIDSYGDGWAGAWPDPAGQYHTLSVFVNGEVVLDEITLLDGTGPEYHVFAANAGDEISTIFTIDGLYAFECYYAIIDPNDNIIAEDGGTWGNPGATTPQGIEPGGDIAVLEPDWNNPMHEFYLDAEVTHVAAVWGGAYQLYRFVVALDEPVDLEEGWISPQIDAANGSGTWFLWLNSQAGDGLAWQGSITAKTSFSRDMVDPRGISEKGQLHSTRDQLDYDLAFELWGGELADPPVCAINPVPADMAVNIGIDGALGWSGVPLADGYYLYFGEPGEGWNIYDGEDIGNVTTYAYTGLEFETEYEWKVVPYNMAGEAEDCPIWTFTTEQDPDITIDVFPWVEDFETQLFPPLGWDRVNVAGANQWIRSTAQNFTPGGSASAFITWNSASTDNYLISPPVDPDADIRLRFFVRKQFTSAFPPDNLEIRISTTDDDVSSFTDLLLTVDVANLPANAWNEFEINLADYTDEVFYVAFRHVQTDGNGLWLDDVTFEYIPTMPVFAITPEAHDFGSVGLGEESLPKTFTISNSGVSVLTVQAPVLDNDDEFILMYDPDDFPAELEDDDTVTFQVVFAPETAGDKTAQVSIGYNDGDDQTAVVMLAGEGFQRPAGSTCGNPFVAELPIVDYTDNTEAYGNDYFSNWVDPATSYLNGYDFVVQFTLDAKSLLSGSVAGSWTGLIIVADCPNPDNPPQRLALASGGSGGSFSNILLEAGTYFAIVSTWPTPNFTDFTLNLSAVAFRTVEFDVLDELGNPIDDAIITLGDVENEPGDYVFHDVLEGSYTYTVTALCYEVYEGEVEVDADMLVTVDLDLNIVPGDANGDGTISVLDLIAIGNHIIDNTPANFCFHNADANADGVINLLDIIFTVNLFSKGVGDPYGDMNSKIAYMLINEYGMYLDSDGTLTGIQFELTGFTADQLKLELPTNHQIMYVENNGILSVVIFSMDNTAIPAGEIALVSFDRATNAEWLGGFAGNLNADEVPVVLRSDEETGIDDVAGLEFNAYPNPATDILFVDFTNTQTANIALINVHGQVVETQSVHETGQQQIRFNLGGLPAGIYMLRIEHKGASFTERIIVK